MRSIKHIALSTILTLGVFGAVLYTSCQKDGCKGVTCLNGGTCAGGICASCPTGIGGSRCEIIYSRLYSSNTYTGFAAYNGVSDTLYNSLTFLSSNDSSNYNKMQLIWNRTGGKPSLTIPIILKNNSTTGSTFDIPESTSDTFTYTGTGTVTATTASVNLVETHPNSPAITVTLSSFIKQ